MSSEEANQEPLEAEQAPKSEEEQPTEEDTNNNDNEPFTALIVLSHSIIFKPDANVLHIVVQDQEDLASCLTLVEESALNALHLVVRAMDVGSMFDPNAFKEWAPKLMAGAELSIHIVADGAQVADDDVDMMRMSLVMAELRLEGQEEQPDGSKIVVGRKPLGVVAEDDEGSDDDEEEDKEKQQKDEKEGEETS